MVNNNTFSMEHYQATEDDAPVVLIPQMYPDFYSHVSDHGTVKPRRRRKRSKAETDASLARKRKLSAEQATQLETSFVNEHKLESGRKDRLASELGLDPRQVAVWFQNRRARWKCKKMEEEYSKLKIVHDTVLMESCRRESEIVKLKEQLMVAEKEIRRLGEGKEVGSSNNSSCSSLSMEAAQLLGMQALENIIFSPEESCYVHQEMEWANLYDM